MDTTRVAVIGIGNMGTAHATALAEGRVDGLTLTAVCDIDAARLADFQGRFARVAAYRDVEDMLRAGGADAVIVAVPHPLHSELAEKALDAGLHALVEKPLDVRLSRARALCRRAKASGKVFALMLNQRTNPLFARARAIVRGGELGALKRTVWIVTNWYRTQRYYDSGSWRATWAGEGGGVLLNQAPHNLDLWQWICGMPCSVTAHCDVARYHRIEVEDDATILTRYENGATGVFITSTGELPGTNRLEIGGERGKLVLEGGVLKWWKLDTSEREICFGAQEGFVAPRTVYEEIRADGPESAHLGILQNFANAIRWGEPLLSPGEDGLRELEISNAAYLSEWTGNRAIPLPMDTDAFDRLFEARVRASGYTAQAAGRKPDGAYNKRWQVNW